MSNTGGPIRYFYDNDEKVTKKLWIAADFEHYIVTTYDEVLRHAYLEAFDRNLNKIWSREFDFKDNDPYEGPIDFTKYVIAINVDNDLYIIDANTGENIAEPLLVGENTKISIVDDGIILVGTGNKDIVMKVSNDGKIIKRNDMDSEIHNIYNVETQLVEGKMVICVSGTVEENRTAKSTSKYIIVNEDGSIENVSVDLFDSDIFDVDDDY